MCRSRPHSSSMLRCFLQRNRLPLIVSYRSAKSPNGPAPMVDVSMTPITFLEPSRGHMESLGNFHITTHQGKWKRLVARAAMLR